MPVLTAPPIFHLFFIANLCLFCRKGKSSVLTAQPFLLLHLCLSSLYYAGNPYLSIFGYGTKIRRPSVSVSSVPTSASLTTIMSFPPHPSAPGGGSVPGHSGRRGGKLYLASVAARAAAAQRKEDRTNVLLARMNKTQSTTPSNREIRYQHRSDEKSQGDDASSKTHTAMEGEKIIFGKLTPVAESSNESTPPPPVVASPALQHPPIVELPMTQQLPCIQLNTQPPSVENSPMQQGVALLVPTYASSNLWRTRMTWLLLCVLLVSCAVIPIVIQTLSLSSHHLHRANKFSNASVG